MTSSFRTTSLAIITLATCFLAGTHVAVLLDVTDYSTLSPFVKIASFVIVLYLLGLFSL